MEGMDLTSLNTLRLSLRAMSVDDAEALLRIGSDSQVSQYTLWETFRSRYDAVNYILCVQQRISEKSSLEWGIYLCDALIGTIGLYRIQDGSAHLGYALARGCWGNGFAAEAAKEVVSWGTGSLGLRQVFADVVQENPASIRVLDKIGFRVCHEPEEYIWIKGHRLRLKHYACVPGNTELSPSVSHPG